ncbi:MAG: tRNA lysidine(34) synthetase TilS [Candidatus Moranbacteria bacterium]|nr:tRNA lysidine(34) synthetase TilS [Candidatus Moranbacteria bacterium]
MKRVQNTVAKYSLWGHQESFIIAVSGGPDSLCLLDVLFLLSKKYSFALHIVHINYRLRGQDSDLDEAHVRQRALAYALPLTVFHPRKVSSSNLEEKLRDIRYRSLEKTRVLKKATLIATAHHQDDQAETFLLRLLRGSGMAGLSAMRPKNGFIVRPFIEMSRVEVLQYLKERGIAFREDQSNSDPRFLRNQIRHTLIPLLEKNYQPKMKKILADTASLLASDYALLTSLPPLPLKKSPGVTEISVPALRNLPEPLLRQELRHLLGSFYPKKSPPKGIIDEFQKLIKSTKNKRQTIEIPGLKIERRGAIVRLLNF